MLTKEQLQPFCSTDETRLSLQTPYVRDGCTYATDGRVAVRVPGEVPGCHVDVNAPDTGKVIDQIPDSGSWIPVTMPEDITASVPCEDCRGDPDHECAACDGTGEVTAKFYWRGTTYDIDGTCPLCDGSGVCARCGGTGWHSNDDPVKLGSNVYSANRLAKVAALPGVMLCDVEGYQPVRFRFDDDGEGAIMPMRMEAI